MRKFSLAFTNLLLLLFPAVISSSSDDHLSRSTDIALAPSPHVPVWAVDNGELAQLDPPFLNLRLAPDGTIQAFDESGNQAWAFLTGTDDGALEPVGVDATDENLEMLKAVIAESPFVTKDTVVLGSSPSVVYAVDPRTGAVIQKFAINGSTHEPVDYPVDPIFIQRTEHSVKLYDLPGGAVRFEAKFAEVQLLKEHDTNIETLGKKPGTGLSTGLIIAHPDKKLQNSRYVLEGSRFTPVKTNMTYELASDFLKRISQANRTYELPNGFMNGINQGGRPSIPGIPRPDIMSTLPLPAEDPVQASKSFSVWWIGGGLVMALIVAVGAIARFFHRKKEKERKQEQKRKKRRKLRVPLDNTGRSEQERLLEKGANGREEQENNAKAEEDRPAEKETRVKLVLTNNLIGSGSNGTRILEGYLDGRSVAVKCMLIDFCNKALKEISALIELDDHTNILRYYAMEKNEQFVYIALERCSFNLENFILAHSTSGDKRSVTNDFERAELQTVLKEELVLWDKGFPTPMLMKLLRDIMNGVVHLHKLEYVHRDLKPQNVLIRRQDKTLVAKLSDMGISKRLEDGCTSFGRTLTSSGQGSSGWKAPEQLRKERQTQAVDMFSLGCLLYFCITAGHHPFGDELQRDWNITKGELDLFLIEHIPEATHLISRLLDNDPDKRPTAKELKVHPFFWTSTKRLSFLIAASERVEREDRELNSAVLAALEALAPAIFEKPWNEKLDSSLVENLHRYRQYNYQGVRDLLRVIRNKVSHYEELPKDVQTRVGAIPEGYESYFRTRFPKLLMEVYKVLVQHCSGERMFERFFGTSKANIELSEEHEESEF